MTRKATTDRLQVPEAVPDDNEKVSPASQRRTRSPHPGVVLMKPDSKNPAWRARCDDPDTGRKVKVRLDPMGAGRTAQTRRAWALQRAKTIAKRRDALSSGAPRATGM